MKHKVPTMTAAPPKGEAALPGLDPARKDNCERKPAGVSSLPSRLRDCSR